MRKLLLLCAAVVAGSLVPVFSGCSNQDLKKKVIGNDASSGDGSVVADSCDAGGIFNYQSAQCESCPAVGDAGMPGACPPDGPVYHCNLLCGDVDVSKSSVDATHQKITVAFSYPLAITGIQGVFFYISATAADGGYLEAGDQQYPTSLDHNVLTMDLSKMPAATFASATLISVSGMQLTDACGRLNDPGLDFSFSKSGSTWTATCAAYDGGP
jgi:hypothetical protein